VFTFIHRAAAPAAVAPPPLDPAAARVCTSRIPTRRATPHFLLLFT